MYDGGFGKIPSRYFNTNSRISLAFLRSSCCRENQLGISFEGLCCVVVVVVIFRVFHGNT